MTDSEAKAREINERVALKLGWTENDIGWKSPNSPEGWHEIEPPGYCRSIEAAWDIVDFVKSKRGFCISRIGENDWRAGWGDYGWGGFEFDVEADTATAPMSICLAFLKLEGK